MVFPGLQVRICRRLRRLKKSTAEGLDGWAWNEIKALSLPWFSVLAILLELVETSGVWPQGLLDAFFAMIPKGDGDSTPLGQRPLSVLPVVYGLWASLRLGHLRVEGLWPKSVLVRAMVFLQSRLGFPLHWTLKRLCRLWVGINCTSWLLTSLSPLTLSTGPFSTVLWVDLGCLTGLGGHTLLITVRFVSGSSLRLAMGMGVFVRVVLKVWFSLLLCMYPGAGVWKPYLLLSPSFTLIISSAVRASRCSL